MCRDTRARWNYTDRVNSSYITALEERCAQLESAIIQVDPLHEAVQDHLCPVTRDGDDLRTTLSPPSSSRASQSRPNRSRGVSHVSRRPLARPESLNTEQNEEELEGTIRNYLEDLSAKAFAETPYVGELSGLTFAKLAKA